MGDNMEKVKKMTFTIRHNMHMDTNGIDGVCVTKHTVDTITGKRWFNTNGFRGDGVSVL